MLRALRRLRAPGARAPRRTAQQPPPVQSRLKGRNRLPRLYFRPWLEGLEDRLVPSGSPTSTAHWVGSAGDASWSRAANWDTGVVPNAGTAVVMGTTAAVSTSTVDAGFANGAVASLAVSGSIHLSLDAPPTVLGPLTAAGSSLLRVPAGNLSIHGTLRLEDQAALTLTPGAVVETTGDLAGNTQNSAAFATLGSVRLDA